MLKGKTVLLGVTGGIAAYKAAALASLLVKQHAAVEVVMTENATKFITPLTFEELTGRRVMVDTFDRNFTHQVEHISLAQRTDLLIIAPATANVCAKLAHGLADDMLTTTALACRCPKLIAPSMNTNMYENPVTQDNLERLRRSRGLSVRDVQQYFGFEQPQAIYKWQYGQSLPSVEHLYALSRLLDTPMESILVEMDQDAFSFIFPPHMANASCLLHPGAKWGIMGTQAY